MQLQPQLDRRNRTQSLWNSIIQSTAVMTRREPEQVWWLAGRKECSVAIPFLEEN